MKWPEIPLGDVVHYRKEFIAIDDLETYKRCRVQLHVQGIVLRDKVAGVEIKTKKQQVCRTDEFLVAEIDAKVGGFGIVPQDLDGAIVSSHYFLFTIDRKRLDPSFLSYFIRTPAFIEQVSARGSTNYAAVRPEHVLKYRIRLPPLPEQRKIVMWIDGISTRLSLLQQLLSQTTEESEALLPSALEKVFSRFERSAKSKRLDEICEVVRGGSPRPAGSPVFYGGSIPFIKVGDLTRDSDKYLYQASATVNELGKEQSRYIDAGTLMLTNSGATLGVPKITAIAACFNDGSQAFLNLTPEVDKEFLYYFFKSKTRWFRDWIARGQGQPNLNTDMTKKMTVHLPPLLEQQATIAFFDALHTQLKALRMLISESLSEMDALLPSILNRAFSGDR